MRDVAIVGAGMTRFGKYQDRGLKELTNEAVTSALESAGMDKTALQVAVVGNAAAGIITGRSVSGRRSSCGRWGSTRSRW